MAIHDEENLDPMKLIFNYNNVFYSFFYDDLSGCIHRSKEYALNYVYSGEMILDNGSEKIHVRKGESVFIPRDHHITMYKKTCEHYEDIRRETLLRSVHDVHTQFPSGNVWKTVAQQGQSQNKQAG